MQSNILYYINIAAHAIQLQYNLKHYDDLLVITLCGHVYIFVMQNKAWVFFDCLICILFIFCWCFLGGGGGAVGFGVVLFPPNNLPPKKPKTNKKKPHFYRADYINKRKVTSPVLPELKQKHLMENSFNTSSISKTFQAHLLQNADTHHYLT